MRARPRSSYNRLGRTAGGTPQGCTAMRHDGRRDGSYGKHGRRHGQKQRKWAIISRPDSCTSDMQLPEGGFYARMQAATPRAWERHGAQR